MFRDKTLIPTEAIRVLALGLLADRPRRYADLAVEVRRFVGLVLGPSLDMLAPSLELLRFEGLAAADAGPGGDAGNPELTLTEAGRRELMSLLGANVRAPVNDTTKLVIALKFRFLHLLPPDAQRRQFAVLADLYDTERARLEDLRDRNADSAGLAAWLDREIAAMAERVAWLKARESDRSA